MLGMPRARSKTLPLSLPKALPSQQPAPAPCCWHPCPAQAHRALPLASPRISPGCTLSPSLRAQLRLTAGSTRANTACATHTPASTPGAFARKVARAWVPSGTLRRVGGRRRTRAFVWSWGGWSTRSTWVDKGGRAAGLRTRSAGIQGTSRIQSGWTAWHDGARRKATQVGPAQRQPSARRQR